MLPFIPALSEDWGQRTETRQGGRTAEPVLLCFTVSGKGKQAFTHLLIHSFIQQIVMDDHAQVLVLSKVACGLCAVAASFHPGHRPFALGQGLPGLLHTGSTKLCSDPAPPGQWSS
jgi:hypothetical protein